MKKTFPVLKNVLQKKTGKKWWLPFWKPYGNCAVYILLPLISTWLIIFSWYILKNFLPELELFGKSWFSSVSKFLTYGLLWKNRIFISIRKSQTLTFLYIKDDYLIINSAQGTLCDMCPNTEYFLVGIFPHSDWIRRESIQFECGKIRTRKNSVFGQFSCSGNNSFTHHLIHPISWIARKNKPWITKMLND